MFDELEDQCFQFDKKIQLQLAVESGKLSQSELDEKVVALRTAKRHTNRARELYEKANSMEEMISLQSLHSNVTVFPEFIALMATEVKNLKAQAKTEVKAKSQQTYMCVLIFKPYP